MKYTKLCSLALAKVAFSVLSLGILLTPTTAQEVQIMVAGPWDYVEDPSDSNRVVLIAPSADHHRDSQIFSGADADHYLSHPRASVPAGVYRIEVCDAAHVICYVPPKQQTCNHCYPYRLQETAMQTISLQYIKDFLKAKNKRHAISLPKPDEYKTFCAKSDVPDPQHPEDCNGLSQQIISTQKIVDPGVVPDPSATDYTTLMVLRYRGWADATAFLSGASDDNSAIYNTFPIKFDSTTTTPAISIAQGPVDDHNGRACDNYSAESFHHSRMNWNLNLYALFPRLKGIHGQDQDRGHFDYYCDQQLTDRYAAFLAARDRYTKTLDDLRLVTNYFNGTDKGIEKEDVVKSLNNAEESMVALFNEPTDLHEPDSLKGDFKSLRTVLEDKARGRTLSAADSGKLADIFFQLDNLMAGATDCRKAQISINKVIPQ